MAFKSRRQGRYEKILTAGFLPFEATTLSRVSLKVPYMKPMIRERAKELAKYFDPKLGWRKGWSTTRWKRKINKEYDDNNWQSEHAIKTGLTKGLAVRRRDAFRMLESKKEEWINKHPEYDSPWKKRGKKERKHRERFDVRESRRLAKGQTRVTARDKHLA